MDSFNEKPLELFIFILKMFQSNTIFDVIFANPDLNTEKYGLKSLKFLYFSRCLAYGSNAEAGNTLVCNSEQAEV